MHNSIDNNTTIGFSYDELSRYIREMTGRDEPIAIAGSTNALSAHYFIECTRDYNGHDRFQVVNDGRRVIFRGNRPRCCLYAVYAFLERQGVRFIRPGPHGEVISKRRSLDHAVDIDEVATYDHRIVCHEGATSIEHAIAMADWMAKHRLNAFQLQFETSLPFWKRWYDRDRDHDKGDSATSGSNQRGGMTQEQARQYDDQLIAELQRRDIDVHRMGHGWTCLAVGVTAEGWTQASYPLDEDKRQCLALVDGRREWADGIPCNTQLCLSNPSAFEGVVNAVVKYAKSHPETASILFCLGDGMNKNCECSLCQQRSVSDWYLEVVKEISRQLTQQGLTTKIHFDAYTDVWWAPKSTLIGKNHASNTVFTFAPFFRCYEHALDDPACDADHPVQQWPLNKMPIVFSNRAYVQLLQQWQDRCDIDS